MVCNLRLGVTLLLVIVVVVKSTFENYIQGQPTLLRYRRDSILDGDRIHFPEEKGCPVPAPLVHGSYLLSNLKCPSGSSNVDCKISHGGSVPHAWNILYSCDSGYTLNTTIASSTCWGTQWIPPLQPACVVEQLCPPLTPVNGTVKCMLHGKEVSCDVPLKPGTTVNLKCKLHYKPILGPENPQLICLPNGHWNDLLYDCIPACGHSKGAVQLSALIYKGLNATVGLFPWHAGIYYRKENDGKISWEQKCGGSLISDQFVLTAAHCVIGREERNIRIALGKYHRSWDHHEQSEEKRGVSKILYPSEFNKNTLVFDIALVQLDEKIKFGEFIMPVCHGLMNGSNDIMDKNLFIVGWGRTEDVVGGPSSEILRYNDVTMLPSKLCRRISPSFFHSDDKFCTIKNNSSVSTALPGDSGGGLTTVFDGLHYIFGIVSDKLDEYAMFTNLTYPLHITWIEGEMRKYDEHFRWIENYSTMFHNKTRPYYSIKGSGTDCVVPEASTNRKFCSLADGCELCDVYHRKCFLPSGSKADSLRVTCSPGYSTGVPEGQVSVCLLDGYWSPSIPECLKTCRPLVSDSLLIRCNLGLDTVDCSKPVLPGTTASFLCSPNFLEFSDLTSSKTYENIITCQSSGRWSNENLPSCEPVCGVSKEVGKLSPLIIDGVEAHVGAFPWHAGIYYYREEGGKFSWVQNCGGSLLTDQIVLTAAHCVVDQDLSSLRIALGKYYRSWDQDEYSVEKRNVSAISVLPGYNKHTSSFDIALVFLSEKIKFGEFIMPVCRHFNGGSNYIQNNNLFLPGWGKTKEEVGSSVSEKLLYNTLMKLPKDQCRKKIPNFFSINEKFCALDNNTEFSIAQPGDSGGGLTAVYKDGLHYILGICSSRINHLSLFTNTTWPTHVTWIENEIRRFYKKYETCRPLVSDSLLIRCNHGLDTVDCSKPALPGTTASFQCSPSFLEAPDLTSSEAYGNIITCQSSGRWSNETLPSCKPVCGVSKEISKLAPLIIDGVEAHVGAFPWHAGLYYREVEGGKILWKQKCGGSLITNQIILTAAHCVEYITDLSSLRIALGKFYRSWDHDEYSVEKRNVSAISVPPDFMKYTLSFDIALVVLSEKIKFGELIMPVCRHFDGGTNYIQNNRLFLPGWGRTKEGAYGEESLSETLLYNTLKTIPAIECRNKLPKYYSLQEKFCGRGENTESSVAQVGDSGGGLTAVYNNKLHYIVGVSSTKTKNLSVFTNTTWPTHLTWIENEIKKLQIKFGEL